MTGASPPSELVLSRWRPSKRGVLGWILVAAVLVALALRGPSGDILHTGGAGTLTEILGALLSMDLSPTYLAGRVLPAAALTVAYAVAAMTVAVAVGIPGALLAGGVLVRRRVPRVLTAGGVRGVLGFLRAIDELIWAVLLVEAVGFSPWAGILGIGLPYGATVGRVLAERLQDVPEGPLEALRSTGASEAQVVLYGRLPAVLADTVSYVLYRFECAVRAAAVLSVAGLGGIGLQLTTALDDLAFDRMWTLLLVLALLVVAIDVVSGAVRRRILA